MSVDIDEIFAATFKDGVHIETTENDCVLWRNVLPEDTKVLWIN